MTFQEFEGSGRYGEFTTGQDDSFYVSKKLTKKQKKSLVIKDPICLSCERKCLFSPFLNDSDDEPVNTVTDVTARDKCPAVKIMNDIGLDVEETVISNSRTEEVYNEHKQSDTANDDDDANDNQIVRDVCNDREATNNIHNQDDDEVDVDDEKAVEKVYNHEDDGAKERNRVQVIAHNDHNLITQGATNYSDVHKDRYIYIIRIAYVMNIQLKLSLCREVRQFLISLSDPVDVGELEIDTNLVFYDIMEGYNPFERLNFNFIAKGKAYTLKKQTIYLYWSDIKVGCVYSLEILRLEDFNRLKLERYDLQIY